MNDKIDIESEGSSELEGWEQEMAKILKKSEAPQLPPEKIEALLATLKPMVTARREEPDLNPPEPNSRWRIGEFLRLVRDQASLFEPPFWMAMGFILLCNLALLMSDRLGALISMLILVLPLFGGIAMIYSLHAIRGGLWEIEQVSAAGIHRIFTARLLLMFGLQLFLALPLLLYYGSQSGGWALARMAVAWLAPTVALSGITLFLFSRWGEWPSVAIAVLVWGSLILFGAKRASFIGFAEMILTHIVFNPLLPLLGALGLAIGLIFGALGMQKLTSRSSIWS